MPTHERQELRQAVVAALLGPLAGELVPTYATSAGARVLETRLAPLKLAQLPAISVYTEEEEVDPRSALSSPRELKRTVNLAIEGWATATSSVDDALDALALEIETAMDVDLHLSNTAFDSFLSSTEVGIKMDGDRPLGAIRLIYSVTYHTGPRVAAIDDIFDTVDTHVSLSDAQAVLDQAHDTVDGINEE